MKKILKRYNEPFSAEVNQSRNKIIEVIAHEKGKKRDCFSFLSSSPVYFDEVTVSDGMIKINVKPKMLNPYRGMGEIHMNLKSGETNSEARMEGVIIPYNSQYLTALYMVIGFLVLWTPLVFAMTSGMYTFIMLVFGWTILPLVLYLIILWNRSRLREYRDFFLATYWQTTINRKVSANL
ncbi:hypothetical protein [Pontibacter beigongshangensis]|uniref:hypothetical protein n=1 Tax=Pontibacter beigongshangensis TaxID=2574733 RepID=UPI00164F4F2E|nr:hypothetical protein [Pontibacter beigongshangensis]